MRLRFTDMKKPNKLHSTFATYSVSRVLGQGGAGFVYKAVDDGGGHVAVKILDPTKATRERLKRFENEYRFCNRNKHPNILTVLDHGLTPDGDPYFVMPLYESSLRPLVGNFEAANALEVFGKILNGAEAAHLQDVVHRDLKPENILVQSEGQEVVLTDFGIARFAAEDLYTAVKTKDGTRLANFQYAAPEQRERGREVDRPADIYALGLILNELFTGRLAHGTNYATISSVHDNLAYLDPIVDRMLQQDPSTRYRSIDEVKKDLLAQKAEWVTRQRLSQLEETVVPETTLDDPLVADPPKIVDTDWRAGKLVIRFHRALNDKWVWALRNIGSYSSVSGKGPEVFKFSGSEARISATSNQAPNVLKEFKLWLPRANQVYAETLKREQEQEQKREKEALRQKVAEEKERLKVLGRLKDIASA